MIFNTYYIRTIIYIWIHIYRYPLYGFSPCEKGELQKCGNKSPNFLRRIHIIINQRWKTSIMLNPLLYMTFQRSSALQSSDKQFHQSRKLKRFILIKSWKYCNKMWNCSLLSNFTFYWNVFKSHVQWQVSNVICVK